MLKGKKLWVVLGVGAVAYYLFMQNKKNQAAKVIAAPATNFTGDLGVLNASGPSDRQLNRLERVMTRNPQRAQRMIKRMF
jgi:uncharacterized protein HemX